MLGCLSLNAETPERSGAEEAPAAEAPSREEDGTSQRYEQVGQDGPGGEGASVSQEGGGEGAGRQVLANNASRRTRSGPTVGAGRRRAGSVRRFCRRVGKMFASLARRSASSSSTTYIGFYNRNRLRSDFRQRILAALLDSRDQSGGADGPSSSTALAQSGGAGTRGEIINQGDHVWREIQEFAISQQGDVYVYIPYSVLEEALSYLSQVLPILSLSLREQKQEGLTREEFEELPVIKAAEEEEEDDDDGECEGCEGCEGCRIIPEDCSVCFNPMRPEDELVALPCHGNHVFHKSCLWKWLSSHSTCPLCREKVQVTRREARGEEAGAGQGTSSSSPGGRAQAQDPSSSQTEGASASTSAGGRTLAVASGSSGSLVTTSGGHSGSGSSRRIFIWLG